MTHKILPLLAISTAFLTSFSFAATPPTLMLSDDAGNVITVDSTGIVTLGGSCTPSTCITASATASSGKVQWAGRIGNFTLSSNTGLTKPVLSNPSSQLDLTLLEIASPTGGTLTVQWTDVGFTGGVPTVGSMSGGGSLSGTGSVTFSAYVDNTNAPFGTGITVGTMGPFSTPSFSQNLPGLPGATVQPYSMTEVVMFNLPAGGTAGGDFATVQTPPVCSGVIGDFVWSDTNGNGLQDVGELGINGITVQLYKGAIIPANLVATTITGFAPAGYTFSPPGAGGAGYYQFSGLCQGSYNVVVDSSQPGLSGYLPTPSMVPPQPANAAIDSNGSPAAVTLPTNSSTDETIDFGYKPIAPLVVTCASSSGIVGVPYDSFVVVTGGVSPYTFSIIGSLPPGLNLNATTGEISGVPTTAGPFSFQVKVVDSSGLAAGTVTTNCGITIAPPPSASCVLITAVQGVAITPVTMIGSGGAGGPYTFSATGLPAGLTMSSGGTISGTPTVSGTFNYTVTITDKNGNTGTANCSVTVHPPPTASCIAVAAIQGVAITPVTITGSGGVGGPYTFSATGLPAGLTMSSGGTISGTPTVSGTFTYTVTIKDSAGNTGTFNCSVTVAPPPLNVCGLTWGFWKNHVSQWPVTTLVLGSQTYSQAELLNILGLPVAGDASINLAHQLIGAKLNVANGTNPATDGGAIAAADAILSTFSGKLPYNVDSSSTVGTEMVNIASQLDFFNSDGAAQPGCNAGPSPLTLACAAGSGQVGVGYSSSLVATGGLAPYTFSIIAGSLPPGLTLNPVTGAITGTPKTAGTFSFTAQAADSTAVPGSTTGITTSKCSITIAPPPQPITLTCPAGTGTVGSSYSSGATVTGGTGPYTYSVFSGALPPGLTLNPTTGAVTGTPTTAGTYSFTLKVVDSTSASATSSNCSIKVGGGIVPGQFVTYTQGGWGAPPHGNNPGALLTKNFTTVYPGGVAIGGAFKLTFTNALAITNFLPQGSTPGALTASATNPTTSSAGVFAGQVLSLELSVDFSNKGLTPTGLANLHVVSGSLAGQTVAQVLALANSVLGGAAPPAGITISDLNNVVDSINGNFDGGTTNNGYLQ